MGVSLLSLTATVLHFVVEGFIIHNMTMYEERQMTWWESFRCGLYCAFYKLISLGSLSGIAEMYYISKHDIDAGRASGITLVQYVYQKLGITILGVLGFISLYISGVSTVREYAGWVFLGTLVAVFIITLLTLISVSKKVADLLAFIAGKLLKIRFIEKIASKLLGVDEKEGDVTKEITDKIYTFNDAGLYFWEHKDLCLRVTLLKMLKMSLWYSIAGITVYSSKSIADPITYFLIPMLLMAVANMIGTVMVAPAGAGTIEFVVALLFTPLYGSTSATVAIFYRFFSLVVPFVLGSVVFATDNPASKPDHD